MDTDIEEIWLDRQKCHTVLSNLLMNALKFSMPESCITINTRRLENKVRISVVDEGAGIQDSDNTGNKERGGGLRALDGNGGGRNAACQEATAGSRGINTQEIRKVDIYVFEHAGNKKKFKQYRSS